MLVSGPDFVMTPRWSPDGRRLCWVEWDHPNMPWDGARLMVREFGTGEEFLVAGGPQESVSESVWNPDETLTFVCDRSGWWNLYRWAPTDGQVRPVAELDADIGLPPWQPGVSRYAALADGRVVFAATSDGYDRLFARLGDGTVRPLELPYSTARALHRWMDASVAMIAATPVTEPAVLRVDLGEESEVVEAVELRTPRDLGIDPA